MLSSTLEEYSEKGDHGEHNQNCTDIIKKRKACRGVGGAFKRNHEGNMGISQAVRASQGTAEVQKQEGAYGAGRLACVSEAERQGVAGGRGSWVRLGKALPFRSHKDLAIILEEAFEEFSGLVSTWGSN